MSLQDLSYAAFLDLPEPVAAEGGAAPQVFLVEPSEALPWRPIEAPPRRGEEVLLTDGAAIAIGSRTHGGWVYSAGGRLVWDGEPGGYEATALRSLGFAPTLWLPLSALLPPG